MSKIGKHFFRLFIHLIVLSFDHCFPNRLWHHSGELDKDGQKKMLAALDSSVRNFMLKFATASRPYQRKKGGKKTRPHSQDLLQAALLESGYSPDFFEGAGCAGMAELLETVKVEFLGTWGVPPALDSLLAKHEMLHVHRLAPWRKQTYIIQLF